MISVTLSLFKAPFRQISLAFLIFIASLSIHAQDEWIDFVVAKDTGVGSVCMVLKYYVQTPNYKYLRIVGTLFRHCIKIGFPETDSLVGVFSFSDSTAALINRI